MEELSGIFRLQRSIPYLGRIVRRSQSSRLVMKSVSAECAAIAGYQRLTQSMGFTDEPAPMMRKHQRSRSWRFLGRAFSGKDIEDEKIGKIEENKKAKKRSSNPDTSSTSKLCSRAAQQQVASRAATERPRGARKRPRQAVEVVLPTPPLPEVMPTTQGVGPERMGRWLCWREEARGERRVGRVRVRVRF